VLYGFATEPCRRQVSAPRGNDHWQKKAQKNMWAA